MADQEQLPLDNETEVPKPILRKSLYELTQDMEALHETLLDASDPETGEIDPNHPALAEIVKNQLQSAEKIEGCLRYSEMLELSAELAEAEYKALKAFIDAHRAEAKRARNRIKAFHFLILRYMDVVGKTELQVGPFRLKRATTKSVTDPPPGTKLSRWEDKFFRVSYAPDKNAIKRAHKEGQPIPPQVEIRETPYLRIQPMRKKGNTDD